MKPETAQKLAADIARLIAEREPEQQSALVAVPLLTVDDVAARLRTNRQAVYRLAREGTLPAVVLGTRSYRWTEQAVSEFVGRGGVAAEHDRSQSKTLRLLRSRA